MPIVEPFDNKQYYAAVYEKNRRYDRFVHMFIAEAAKNHTITFESVMEFFVCYFAGYKPYVRNPLSAEYMIQCAMEWPETIAKFTDHPGAKISRTRIAQEAEVAQAFAKLPTETICYMQFTKE
jgi:hypothetical protein